MTNSHTGWAPVVHGRTYRVDFRPHLLVVPDWFTDDDIAAVREFVRASTRSAENLPDGPRWLMVKTNRFQVAGVTCMAATVSADMTHDRPDPGSGGTGRPLYVFLGWATRDLAANPPPMDLEFYKQLYQFVRNRWDNAPPDDAADAVGAPFEQFPEVPYDSQIALLTHDPDKPGSENSILSVWPDSRRATLWASAARHPGPVSLCLGMARSRDAEESPLGNITVSGSDQDFTHNRTPKPAAGTTGRYTNMGRHEAEAPASGPPRRQSVAISVIEFILKAIDSLLRMIGMGGQSLLRMIGMSGQEGPNAPPASDQPAVPPVGMGEILRPVRPSAGRPKADAFDAFDEPKPKPAGRPSAPAATDTGTSPSPEQKLSNDERLEEQMKRNLNDVERDDHKP